MSFSLGKIASLYRFTIEQRPDTKQYVLVDWKFGTILAAGTGKRAEQERKLNWIRNYLRTQPDIYVLRMPKRFGDPPEWPGGIVPPVRRNWMEQAVAISRAYAAVGESVRRFALGDEELATDFQVRYLIRQAEALKAEALCEIGLMP